MKKISLALGLVAASLFSTGAMAQAYVSGHLGFGHVEADCSGVSACDESDTAKKITGGYGLGNGFALELGYIDFGKVSFSESGISGGLKVSGLTFGGAYSMPLGKSVDLGLRLGVARLKTKYDLSGFGTSYSNSETATSPYAGIGLGYAIDKNLKVEAGLDFSRAEYDNERSDVRAFTVGARYAF